MFEVSNKEIINTLVRNHFDLDESSKNIFTEKLFNENNQRLIDPKLKEILGDDLRLSIPLSEDTFPLIDNGWNLFRTYFSNILDSNDFTSNYKVDYKSYKTNKIVSGKNQLKLFKAVKKFYKEHEDYLYSLLDEHYELLTGCYGESEEEKFEKLFLKVTEEIGTHKLPNKNLKVVLSANFADFFMCSTSESWGSCLNVNSSWEGSYWGGLPGLIADPNRFIIYITDGQTKEYKGITVEKMLSRTWAVLTDTDEFFPVRSYPLDFFDYNVLNKVIPSFNFIENGKHWDSKYPLEILLNNDSESCYIYQDHSDFVDTAEGYKLTSTRGGGMSIIRNGDINEGVLYRFEAGLDYLVENDLDLSRYREEPCTCGACGDSIDREEAYVIPEGDLFCETCYYEQYAECTLCGKIESTDDVTYHSDDTFCENCASQHLTECSECSDIVYKCDVNEEGLCEDCREG